MFSNKKVSTFAPAFRKGVRLFLMILRLIEKKDSGKFGSKLENFLSLQPLSLFEQRSSMTEFHKQWVVQEHARDVKFFVWVKNKPSRKRNLVTRRNAGAVVLSDQVNSFRCAFFLKSIIGKKKYLQWRVWSWLRMNASYRLNTCKSRGSTSGGDRRTGE